MKQASEPEAYIQMIDSITRSKIVEMANEALPGSKLVQLGPSSLDTVFQYAERSALEKLVVLYDSNHVPVGFSLISLSPQTLGSRLLRDREFLFSFALNFWRIRWRMPSFQTLYTKNIEDKPEAIFVCINEAYRGQGWGRKLIAEIETILKEENIKEYTVKTETKDNERVIEFYSKNGFIEDQHMNLSSDYFVFLNKNI